MPQPSDVQILEESLHIYLGHSPHICLHVKRKEGGSSLRGTSSNKCLFNYIDQSKLLAFACMCTYYVIMYVICMHVFIKIYF